MMVRVRDPNHLDNLVARFPDLAGCKRLRSNFSDYPERLFVPKLVWVDVVAALVTDVSYDNFKSAVSRTKLTAPNYTSALHSVWGTLHHLQPPRKRLPQQPFFDFGAALATPLDVPSLRQTCGALLDSNAPGATFLAHDSLEALNVAPWPDAEDDVLLVSRVTRHGKHAQPLGVIQFPDAWTDDEQAYAEAVVDGGMTQITPRKRLLERVRWADVVGHDLKLYNPYVGT